MLNFFRMIYFPWDADSFSLKDTFSFRHIFPRNITNTNSSKDPKVHDLKILGLLRNIPTKFQLNFFNTYKKKKIRKHYFT